MKYIDCGVRRCVICGCEFSRNTGEKPKRFNKRLTCSATCFAAYKSKRMASQNVDPDFKAHLHDLNQTDAYRERRSQAIKAAYQRPGVKTNLRKAMQEVNSRPEVNEKRSQTTRATYALSETRARVGAAVKAAWQRPEMKEQRAQTDALPETKRNRSLAQSRCNAEPEVRKRKSLSAYEVGSRPEIKAMRSTIAKQISERPETKLRRKQYWEDPVKRARHILASAQGSGGTGHRGSKPELLLRQHLDVLGIPYIANAPFVAELGGGIPDLRFPSARLIIEVDGAYWHNAPDRQRRDKKHEEAYRQAGYLVIRLDAADVAKNPGSAVELIIGVITRRSE